MAQLAFFPWLVIEADLTIGPFRLLCYKRGRAPASGADQRELDAVLTPYLDSTGHPITQATILTVGHRALTDDMTPDTHTSLFEFADLIAFSALAARRFFVHMGYCNRDQARLVIQGFKDPGGGALIRTRRRDGATSSYFTPEVYAVRCPHHVHAFPAALDAGLLLALESSREHEDWPMLTQAISLFDEANTDRDSMPEAAELVLSYATLEQLLDCAGSPSNGTASVFAEFWVPAHPVPQAEWRISSRHAGAVNRLARSPSLRFAWIEDMAIARGSVAHGHEGDAYRGLWTVSEHLLLAAFAVPRLVKLHLSSIGAYSLTETDTAERDLLEELLNERHLIPRDETDPTPHPWAEALNRGVIREVVRVMTRQILQKGDTK